MELVTIEKKKNRFVFELRGADHTFCNALKNELLNDKAVKIATYAIKHPLEKVPTFIVETKGLAPVSALTKAVSRLRKANAEFLKTFKTAIKKK